MMNFVLCDDENNMLNKLSILFEKTFVKNDFDAQIVLKTSDYKEVISFMDSNIVDVIVLDIEFKNSNLNGLDMLEKFEKLIKTVILFLLQATLNT